MARRARAVNEGADAFRLSSGAPVSRLGQGAWKVGDDRRKRTEELLALNWASISA